jgi:hypothetical protein
MSNNPFEWYKRTEPSIFAQDPAFTYKSNGKTTSQMATEKVDEQRKQGKMPGTIQGLGVNTDKYLKYREHQIATRPENLVAVHKNGPKAPKGNRKTAKGTTPK